MSAAAAQDSLQVEVLIHALSAMLSPDKENSHATR
ncbi:MAG: hypothetical protein RL189_2342 [Pseudomonadota bacterium]|jgi:hypothetical protein